jgi:type II secretory pathway component PulF
MIKKFLKRLNDIDVIPRKTWRDFYKFCAMAHRESDKDPGFVIETLAEYEKGRSKSMARFWAKLSDRYDTGAPISKVLEPYLPTEELLIIKPSDVSKNYEDAFTSVGRFAEIKGKLRNIRLSSTLYPLAILVAIHTVIIMKLEPTVRQVVAGISHMLSEVPQITLNFFAYVDFIKSNKAILVGSLLIIFFIAFRRALKNWKPADLTKAPSLRGISGRIRSFFDVRVPGFVGYREIAGYSFVLSVGALMTQMRTEKGIAVAMEQTSPWMRVYVKSMLAKATDGKSSAEIFDSEIVPKQLRRYFFLYDRAGALDQVLTDPPKEVIEELYSKYRRVYGFIGLLMLAATAGFILWSFMSLVFPIYDLNAYLQNRG